MERQFLIESIQLTPKEPIFQPKPDWLSQLVGRVVAGTPAVAAPEAGAAAPATAQESASASATRRPVGCGDTRLVGPLWHHLENLPK